MRPLLCDVRQAAHRLGRFVTVLGVGVWVVACADRSTGVTDASVTRLVVSPDAVIPVIATATLLATAYNAQGDRVTAHIAWSSSDTTIVRVDQNGRMSGIAVGDAIISARTGSFTSTTRIGVRPANMRIVVDSLSSIARDDTFLASAVFLDALGVETSVPWVVDWSVSPSTALRVEYINPPLNHTVRLHAASTSISLLTARARDFTQSQTIYRNGDGDEILLTQFYVASIMGRDGRWSYAPVLFATSLSTNVIVSRITYSGEFGTRSSCGLAALDVYANIPLYDFQPYNYAWTGGEPAQGATVRAELTVEHAGTKRKQIVTGPVVKSGFTVADFGTNGFAWSECQ